ncbi:MAG: hypothetical protein CVU57_22900 [Deltaproteobacteria bacterium HGW-Deltaproteobacteria-15]|jgi:hypothetical protein|nr:MAG: hypothetical protein CVU57_22900 [Deltaproteobacteria bacterium HGW-Deltaproteobacteria-15]
MEGYDYAKCIEISKRVRWDIDKDVIRARDFDLSHKFLPDGLSKVDRLDFLNEEDKKFLGQIQGRTYANMFGFVERFIVAKILEITKGHWLGDQVALEALVRFCDEELKHQELFRRIEPMLAVGMPPGYIFPHQPDAVAAAVLEKSTWTVLALILEIELFTQEHYRQSIEPDENLSPLFKDIFFFHMKEETTHALMDELEWPREDEKLTPMERDRAVDQLIDLVGEVDGLLQVQSNSDVDYFLKVRNPALGKDDKNQIRDGVIEAYRYQYIFSGVGHPRFQKLLGELTTEAQQQRVSQALSPLM